MRNVRSDGHGGGWLGLPRWFLISAACSLITFVGCCGMNMCQMPFMFRDAQKQMEELRAQMEADRKARTVVVKAEDLLQAFDDDAAEADKKYKGKYLEMTGVVDRTGKDGHGILFAVVHGGDEDAKVKVECFFGFETTRDEKQLNDQLPKGKTATIRGEYTGRVSNVQMRDCSLAK